MNDILIEEGRQTFSYRVAGILRRHDQVLLQYDERDHVYAFIGGHVAFQEHAEDALKREWMEELHLSIHVVQLAWVGEVFFKWNTQTCHQISLYFEVQADQFPFPLPQQGNIRFRWVSLDELKRITLYPQKAREFLLAPQGSRFHFVDEQV